MTRRTTTPSLRDLAMAGLNGTAREYEQPAPQRLSNEQMREQLLRALRGDEDDEDEDLAAGGSHGQQGASLPLNDDAGLARAILGPNHGGN